MNKEKLIKDIEKYRENIRNNWKSINELVSVYEKFNMKWDDTDGCGYETPICEKIKYMKEEDNAKNEILIRYLRKTLKEEYDYVYDYDPDDDYLEEYD